MEFSAWVQLIANLIIIVTAGGFAFKFWERIRASIAQLLSKINNRIVLKVAIWVYPQKLNKDK